MYINNIAKEKCSARTQVLFSREKRTQVLNGLWGFDWSFGCTEKLARAKWRIFNNSVSFWMGCIIHIQLCSFARLYICLPLSGSIQIMLLILLLLICYQVHYNRKCMDMKAKKKKDSFQQASVCWIEL
jgi:hypothetical protein